MIYFIIYLLILFQPISNSLDESIENLTDRIVAGSVSEVQVHDIRYILFTYLTHV